MGKKRNTNLRMVGFWADPKTREELSRLAEISGKGMSATVRELIHLASASLPPAEVKK